MTTLAAIAIVVQAVAVVGIAVAASRAVRQQGQLVHRVLTVAAYERRFLIEAIVARHSNDLARTTVADNGAVKHKVQVPKDYLDDERAVLEQLGEDPSVLVGVGGWRPHDPDQPRQPEGL